ncbi:peptidoglycan-binding domain-containing protein [Intrasporangium sp. YIM S08009]|uniref:peptidoglycan-binding domain-containing protein n=1 Tax=Intrasporangium zincisolvens TaxID=3080018 RepID=UPI002B05E554|nr:peptidoglycan-binding domain-containing protein [Intrasporangium sp. YIM S08009]
MGSTTSAHRAPAPRAARLVTALLAALALTAVAVIGHDTPAQAVSSLTTRQLQQDLWGLLYYSGPIDGVNGSGTKAAVRAFQKDNCLTQDGVAGAATQPKVIAKVKAVQTKAGASADGVYGPVTTSKVKAYQKAHGIPTGGQAGPQTMKAMGIKRVLSCTPTPPPSGGSTVGGTISRTEVLARAKYWTDRRVPYSMNRYTGDPQGRQYRTDCSGFVSMAWHLSSALSTVTLPSVSHRITKGELRPGDVLLKGGPGSAGASGHVVLFRGWANSAHTSYYASEESGSHGAIARTVPYPYFSGYGTFLPYRYGKITG